MFRPRSCRSACSGVIRDGFRATVLAHALISGLEPNDIAERYHKALGRYLDEVHQATIETAVDYHRIRIDADYEQVLLSFLIGRTRAGSVR